MKDSEKKTINKRISNCEDCEFYSYDEDVDAYVCNLNLDMDEMEHFVHGDTSNCPYYRFYDEYKLVAKQN